MPFSALFFSPVIFFFTDTATTEIYTLSLHDALPIWALCRAGSVGFPRLLGSLPRQIRRRPRAHRNARDRKSTRLNSSHITISYAVFCLKKKKKKKKKEQKNKEKNTSLKNTSNNEQNR